MVGTLRTIIRAPRRGGVASDSAIYLVGFLGAALVQFLAVPVYTRTLGPENYAQFSLALATTSSLAGVLVLGGDVSLSRFWFAARTDEERRTLAATWIGALAAWSVLVVGVVIAFAGHIAGWLAAPSGFSRLLILGLITLVPAQLSRMLAQILRNEFRPIPFSLTTVLIAIVGLSLGLLLTVVAGMGPAGILLGLLAAETSGCLMRFPLVARALRGKLSFGVLRAPLRFGLPLVPASLAMWVFAAADKIAIARYLPDQELGAYAVAFTLVAPFGVVVVALGQAWIPRISQVYETSAQRAREQTARAIELALISFGACALVAGLAAPLAISVLAGRDYLNGAAALPLLALGATFRGASLFTATGYLLAKRTRLVPVITVFAALTTIGLLAVLVPAFGLVGAAASACAGYFLLAFGMLAYSQSLDRAPVRGRRVTIITLVLLAQTAVTTSDPSAPLAVLSTLLSLVALAALAVSAKR